MTGTDCNEVSSDAMWASAGWVIAGGEVPEKGTGGVSDPVDFQHRIVVGREASDLAGVWADPQETKCSRSGCCRLLAQLPGDFCACVRPRK